MTDPGRLWIGRFDGPAVALIRVLEALSWTWPGCTVDVDDTGLTVTAVPPAAETATAGSEAATPAVRRDVVADTMAGRNARPAAAVVVSEPAAVPPAAAAKPVGYSCDNCGKTFTTRQALGGHTGNAHRSDQPRRGGLDGLADVLRVGVEANLRADADIPAAATAERTAEDDDDDPGDEWRAAVADADPTTTLTVVPDGFIPVKARFVPSGLKRAPFDPVVARRSAFE